jgi:mono/diheme cytochrome c family protein
VRVLVKWALRAVLAVSLVALASVTFLEIRGIPSYPPPRVDVHVEVTPERVARGKKWAASLCNACHTDPLTRRLTGRRLDDVPAAFGTIWSKNITRDPVHGIGAWTDGELVTLLRTGIRKNGKYAPVPMPKLAHMGDEDVASIVAFLRSDDELVQPSDAEVRDSDYGLLVKFLCLVAWKPLALPPEPIVPPPPSDTLALGKYLTTTLECYACHSADFKKIAPVPEQSAGYFGGGNAFLDYRRKNVYGPNITPDETTGIGTWSAADFRHAMLRGLRPDGSVILTPMQIYPELAEGEIDAMFAYLRTVPKIVNPRKKNEYEPPSGLPSGSGRASYFKARCDACHAENGVYECDLRPGAQKFPTEAAMSEFLKRPDRVYPGTKMPGWASLLNAEELASLSAHVRSLGAHAR